MPELSDLASALRHLPALTPPSNTEVSGWLEEVGVREPSVEICRRIAHAIAGDQYLLSVTPLAAEVVLKQLRGPRRARAAARILLEELPEMLRHSEASVEGLPDEVREHFAQECANWARALAALTIAFPPDAEPIPLTITPSWHLAARTYRDLFIQAGGPETLSKTGPAVRFIAHALLAAGWGHIELRTIEMALRDKGVDQRKSVTSGL